MYTWFLWDQNRFIETPNLLLIYGWYSGAQLFKVLWILFHSEAVVITFLITVWISFIGQL